MFKRNVTVVNSHQLSGKDVKKLSKSIVAEFPSLEKSVKEIIPSKTEVVITKFSNKCSAFSCGGNPVFFEYEQRLYPTVYTMWQYPNLVPTLFTHSEVSPKIVGGADLMLPGVIVPEEGLGEFAVDDRSTISIPENKFPFAVGYMQTDSETIKENGLKGRGVKLLHHYPDVLWALGSKTQPNEGFKRDRIYPFEEESEGVVPGEGTEEEVTSKIEGLDVSGKGSGGEAAKNHGASMDELVDTCFLKALHLKLRDQDLPMDCGAFYSQCMLPCRPRGTEIEIRKTSYKKLSKLIKKMEKRGLISVKQSKKEDRITAVNREHEVYKLFGDELADMESEESEPAPPAAKGKQTEAKQIEVHEVFRAVSNLRPVLGEEAVRNKEMLFSAEEVRGALVLYSRTEKLFGEGGDESVMMLNKVLKSGLYGKKEGVEVGSKVELSDVYKRLMSKMQTYHKVVCDGAEVVKKGKIKNIHVTAEDRHAGRKFITKVSQLESFSIDPADFGNTLQRKYKCSSTVTKLPGKNETGKEVSFQGNLLEEICKYLETDCGIHPKYIEKTSRMKR